MFIDAPASTKHHHVYEGGLAIHTAEVVWFAKRAASGLSDNDRQNLVTAACLHDAMKANDYQQVMDKSGPYDIPKDPPEWFRTDYADKIYHIAGGPIQLGTLISDLGLSPTTEDLREIYHMMLSHHGRKEWGSPVEPKTAGAHILHCADNLSLKLGLTGSTNDKERIDLWR